MSEPNKPPRIAVVTAIIGGIDQIKEVPTQSLQADWLFYDKPSGFVEGNDRQQALWYKTHIAHTDNYDIVIWLDGKVKVLAYDFLEQIVTALGPYDIAVMKHNERDCIYKEVDHIEHCMRKGNAYLLTRYATKPIRAQVEAYRYFGYPANNGLFDCCIIAVWASKPLQEVMSSWWKDVYFRNGFDQTALPFYCWRAGLQIQPIVFKPASFIDVPHVKPLK